MPSTSLTVAARIISLLTNKEWQHQSSTYHIEVQTGNSLLKMNILVAKGPNHRITLQSNSDPPTTSPPWTDTTAPSDCYFPSTAYLYEPTSAALPYSHGTCTTHPQSPSEPTAPRLVIQPTCFHMTNRGLNSTIPRLFRLPRSIDSPIGIEGSRSLGSS
jgi:hypothetical protein